MTSPAWFARTTGGYTSWASRLSGSVERDFSPQWSIDLSGPWGTLEINATISGYVDKDYQSTYSINSTVASDFSALYSVDGAAATSVARDFASVYAIIDELASFNVERDFSPRWRIEAYYRDFSVLWDIGDPTTQIVWTEADAPSSAWTPAAQPSSTWTPQTTSPTGWS